MVSTTGRRDQHLGHRVHSRYFDVRCYRSYHSIRIGAICQRSIWLRWAVMTIRTRFHGATPRLQRRRCPWQVRSLLRSNDVRVPIKSPRRGGRPRAGGRAGRSGPAVARSPLPRARRGEPAVRRGGRAPSTSRRLGALGSAVTAWRCRSAPQALDGTSYRWRGRFQWGMFPAAPRAPAPR